MFLIAVDRIRKWNAGQNLPNPHFHRHRTVTEPSQRSPVSPRSIASQISVNLEGITRRTTNNEMIDSAISESTSPARISSPESPMSPVSPRLKGPPVPPKRKGLLKE